MNTIFRVTGGVHIDSRWSARNYTLGCLLLVGFLIGVDLLDAPIHNGDIDDTLRALQVQALLRDGGWLNPTIPGINMPGPYISAWSRLVDLPYVLIAFTLQSTLGQELALTVAFFVWPVVMAILFCIALVAVLRRLAPGRIELSSAILTVIICLMPYAVWEFTPGRIDHHNVQMLLLLTQIYGIARFDRIGGIIVGTSATTSLVVGLETLPVVALALTGFVIAWTAGMKGARTVLACTATACLIAVPLLTLLLIGPSGFWLAQNDAFSAPFAAALIGFGAIIMVLLRHVPETLVGGLKFAFVASAGLALLAVLLTAYPELLSGPYTAIDDLVRVYWFDRIDQEKSALHFFRVGDFNSLGLLSIFTCILVVSFRRANAAVRRGEPAFAIIYVIAAGVFLTTLASNRYLRFAAVVVPLLLPAVFSVLRELHVTGNKRLLAGYAGIAAAIALATASIHFIVPVAPKTADAFDYLLWNDCKGADFSVLATLEPGHIMTPPALGLEIARRSPPGLAVSSIPFHRSAPAISQVLQVFMSSEGGDRKALLAGFDYLAVCRAPVGLPAEEKMPMFRTIMAARSEPQLHPLSVNRREDLIVLKIDR